MSRQQGYNPWMDFHDGHKVQTMRLDHFKAGTAVNEGSVLGIPGLEMFVKPWPKASSL